MDFSGQSITVTVAQEWLTVARTKKYFCNVLLPLPQDAAVQNYALMALTSIIPLRVGEGREHLNYSEPIWPRTLCRKIGLRNNKAARLAAVAAAAEPWFGARGGRVWLRDGMPRK